MSGIFHNPFLLSIGTWIIILPLSLNLNPYDLNTGVHTTSQLLPIYTSDMCVRLGVMWTSLDLSGKAGKSSKLDLLGCMVWTLGYPT